MQPKYEIVCFYQGKRQRMFAGFASDTMDFWLRWTQRNYPNSNPEIKEIHYALEETSA